MMSALVVVGCTSAVCQSVREATTASGVDNAALRLADTAERDYFTLRERLITMQKQLEGEPRSILMSKWIELPISMGNSCNYCGANTHALPAESNA